jgi:hypothetical protein
MPPDPQAPLRAPAASSIATLFVLTGCPAHAASASGPAPPPAAPGAVASANDIDADAVESR